MSGNYLHILRLAGLTCMTNTYWIVGVTYLLRTSYSYMWLTDMTQLSRFLFLLNLLQFAIISYISEQAF